MYFYATKSCYKFEYWHLINFECNKSVVKSIHKSSHSIRNFPWPRNPHEFRPVHRHTHTHNVHVCGTCCRCAVIRLYMLYIHYIPGIKHTSGGNLELYSHSHSYSYSDTRIAIHWVLRSCAWLHVATAHGCGHGMGIYTIDVLTEQRANAVQTDPKSTWLNLTKPKSSRVENLSPRPHRKGRVPFWAPRMFAPHTSSTLCSTMVKRVCKSG